MNAREQGDEAQRELDRAYEGLERETPDRVSRMIRWLRSPQSRYVRIPLAILFIAQSFFFFLPLAGIEFLPIGLLLIAQDVPFLKRPVARAMLWLEKKWVEFRKRRQQRKRQTQ
jgi:hypothetical protein